MNVTPQNAIDWLIKKKNELELKIANLEGHAAIQEDPTARNTMQSHANNLKALELPVAIYLIALLKKMQ
jgi:hypothetical protein